MSEGSRQSEDIESDTSTQNRPESAEEKLVAPRDVQLTVIAAYPVALAASSLASIWAPSSYFGDKRNFFNQQFVKIGWFWFTIVFWFSWILRNANAKRSLSHVTARYAAATAWWVLFTQWCFGAPLMDRIFLLTGGSCDDSSGQATSRECRAAGGRWTGGHDPSGHVFLLVQSSLVLFMEILPALWHRFTVAPAPPLSWGVKLPLVLLALWLWMLLMTGVYFHSFIEKFSGLLFGTVEVLVVYVWGESQSWGKLFGVC